MEVNLIVSGARHNIAQAAEVARLAVVFVLMYPINSLELFGRIVTTDLCNIPGLRVLLKSVRKMMASLEVLLLMMTTADIGFTTELLQERRPVWEGILYATFLVRIFCFAKRSTFLILKSSLGSVTELLNHEPLDTIW